MKWVTIVNRHDKNASDDTTVENAISVLMNSGEHYIKVLCENFSNKNSMQSSIRKGIEELHYKDEVLFRTKTQSGKLESYLVLKDYEEEFYKAVCWNTKKFENQEPAVIAKSETVSNSDINKSDETFVREMNGIYRNAVTYDKLNLNNFHSTNYYKFIYSETENHAQTHIGIVNLENMVRLLLRVEDITSDFNYMMNDILSKIKSKLA